MARSTRNNDSADKAPRRSTRTRNEPDKFTVPIPPPKAKKGALSKKRVPKEPSAKATPATRNKKEKQKKPVKASKAAKKAKKAAEPKSIAGKKRARQDEHDEEDQPRASKRSRVTANLPRRTMATRKRPLSHSPLPSPSPIIKDEDEENRVSPTPTEVEPEWPNTGTDPDMQLVLNGPLIHIGLPHPQIQPANQQQPVHTPPAGPAGPLPPNPNPLFAPVAGPAPQPQPPLAHIEHGNLGAMQGAILGFEPMNDEEAQAQAPPEVIVVPPLQRENAVVFTHQQQ